MLEFVENKVFAAALPQGRGGGPGRLLAGVGLQDDLIDEAAAGGERRLAGQAGAQPLVQFGRIPPAAGGLGKEEAPWLGFLDLPGYVPLLVAVVPDPLDSSSAQQFDSAVEAIQRAAERHGYVLDRSWLPWKASDSGNGALGTRPAGEDKGRGDERRLAVLVFRKHAGQAAQFLLVCLIRDTAIRRAHK